MISKQALAFFGHTIRASGMEKDTILVRVEGTRRRGKQRTRWLDVLKELAGMSLHQLNETAMNKLEFFRGSPEVTIDLMVLNTR